MLPALDIGEHDADLARRESPASPCVDCMQLVERQPAPKDGWLQPQRGRRKGPQMRSRRREDELRASFAERHGVVHCRVGAQAEEA